MNEQTTSLAIEETEADQEAKQLMLNAQIAYSIDGFADAAHTLELDGIHPSALVTASLATFVQMICASSILADRTLEEVQAAIKGSMDFTEQYATEVYNKMKAEQNAV